MDAFIRGPADSSIATWVRMDRSHNAAATSCLHISIQIHVLTYLSNSWTYLKQTIPLPPQCILGCLLPWYCPDGNSGAVELQWGLHKIPTAGKLVQFSLEELHSIQHCRARPHSNPFKSKAALSYSFPTSIQSNHQAQSQRFTFFLRIFMRHGHDVNFKSFNVLN